jgi:hypothetical protein
MGIFNFTLPNGKPFEIKGPPGLSLEQAKAVFDKQAATGSLVGIKPGGVLSAATQASQGLPGAQSILAQAQSGVTGALGAGIPGAVGDIGSLTKSLGAAGGALEGSLNGIAPGVSGAVGIGAAKDALTSVSTLSEGASAAITTVNKTIAGTPLTDPVGIADFAKQAPALTAIEPLTQAETTGVLAQAKKLVNQGADVLSSEKGLGAFGFGADQLEKAGVLKPGMSKFVKSGASSLANLLKSPAAFTGKDGIKSADDLLANPPKQELIQQDLMKQGLAGLKALGVPPLALSAVGAAGAALNSAVSPEQAANFLKGVPVVGDKLAEKFAANTRDGAFAATLAKDKIPPAFKAEVTPEPAGDTVNRDTVNAASARVVGNPKVPEPNYGPTKPNPGADAQAEAAIKDQATAIAASLAAIEKEIATLDLNVTSLESRETITDAQYDAVLAERQALVEKYNNSTAKDIGALREVYNSASASVKTAYKPVLDRITKIALDSIVAPAVELKRRLNELSKKRQGVPPPGGTQGGEGE